MHKLFLLSFLPVALLAICGEVRADATVVIMAAKPSMPVIASYEAPAVAGNTTVFYRGTGAFRRVGQSFTSPKQTAQLTGFTFKIWDLDSQAEGKKISLKIYRLSAVNKPPVDRAGDLLHEETGVLPGALEAGQYLTFTFSEAVKLEPAGAYLVMFGFTEPTSKDGTAKVLGFERSASNASFGRLWVDNGESFAADNKAMTFFAHGK